MGKEELTVFLQNQRLGKFLLCALMLPRETLLFVTWASCFCFPDAPIFTFYIVRIWCPAMEITSLCFWLWYELGQMPLETDSRETEHSIYELSVCCLSWGPDQCRLLGPEPCCMTWFITRVSVKYLSHHQWFFCTQGERWASLCVAGEREGLPPCKYQ